MLYSLETLEEWTSGLENAESIDAIYLDISKAFNSVPHQRLLLKLQACGVNGKFLSWVEAFLTGRQQRVRVNSSKSEWVAVSQLLYVVYVNGLSGEASSSIKMLADDTKMYRSVSRASDVLSLQANLHRYARRMVGTLAGALQQRKMQVTAPGPPQWNPRLPHGRHTAGPDLGGEGPRDPRRPSTQVS